MDFGRGIEPQSLWILPTIRLTQITHIIPIHAHLCQFLLPIQGCKTTYKTPTQNATII
jgi:hypothetical protein